MPPPQPVQRIARGAYRVEHKERHEIVYAVDSPRGPWAFWNGQVFRDVPSGDGSDDRKPRTRSHVHQSLSSPMPATVVKVLVSVGSAVKKGDTVVVLEAMKMELPVRAPSDAVVKAVHYREGDLVQPDAALVELE